MQRIDDAGRAGPLVLELASGTARLHGEELELPLREFRLLAALAARVGQPVSSKALIEAVWAEEAEWTAPENLTVLVSKLRRLIDGPDKFGKHIRNRRGYGYLLDLEPDQLIVIDPDAVEPTPLTIDLTDKPAEQSVSEPEVEPPVVEEEPQARRPRLRALPALGVVVVLLAASWGAGYALSRRASDRAQPDAPAVEPAQRDQGPEGTDRRTQRRELKPDRGNRKQSREGRGGQSGPAAIAAPGTTDTPAGAGSAPPGGTQGSRKDPEKKEPAPPPLPPAPTRYLYHLVNEQSGDHFVTTDGNTASEYEAKGYEGGVIGRIYSYQEDGTRAITTDTGTGYVFMSASPKTEPASKPLALWYSTDNNGDFFYTTSESEAKQQGWSGSLIGYVRSL